MNEEVNQENSNKNPVINSTQRDYMAEKVSKDLVKTCPSSGRVRTGA